MAETPGWHVSLVWYLQVMISSAAGSSPAADSTAPPADRIERVPYGDRWMADAWEMFPVPGGFGLLLADMTQVKAAMRILRNAKIPATYPHLFVRAAALALARNKDSHQLVCNYQRLLPGTVDIGLSMAGETTYAPVVVLPAVDRKPLWALIPAVIEAVDIAAAKESRDLAIMRRWIVPFRFLRRLLLRVLNRSLTFRRRIVGTFQVTCLNNVDIVVPLVFYSSAILGVGAIRDRVVASEGKAVVRPTAWLSGTADHSATDGLRGGDVLRAIKEILESDELVREAREASVLMAARRGHVSEPRLAPAEQAPAEAE
jgi:hypothetical protein